MKKKQIDNFSLEKLSKEEFHSPTELPRVMLAIFDLVVTLGIMTLATSLSFFFRHIGFHESNFIMAYILGVLIVAKQTRGHVYGILASVIGVSFRFRLPLKE